MQHGEYLRRKTAAQAQVIGPYRPGDASETTRIRNAVAANAGKINSQILNDSCCRKRIGQGQGTSASQNKDNTSRVLVSAGCAMISSGTGQQIQNRSPITVIAGCIPNYGTIQTECCPQDWTPEVPRDASGNPLDPITSKSLAYKSAKAPCDCYYGFPSDVRNECC